MARQLTVDEMKRYIIDVLRTGAWPSTEGVKEHDINSLQSADVAVLYDEVRRRAELGNLA